MSEIINTTMEYCLIGHNNFDADLDLELDLDLGLDFVEEPFELPLVMEMMLFWHVFAMIIIGTMFYMTKDF